MAMARVRLHRAWPLPGAVYRNASSFATSILSIPEYQKVDGIAPIGTSIKVATDSARLQTVAAANMQRVISIASALPADAGKRMCRDALIRAVALHQSTYQHDKSRRYLMELGQLEGADPVDRAEQTLALGRLLFVAGRLCCAESKEATIVPQHIVSLCRDAVCSVDAYEMRSSADNTLRHLRSAFVLARLQVLTMLARDTCSVSHIAAGKDATHDDAAASLTEHIRRINEIACNCQALVVSSHDAVAFSGLLRGHAALIQIAMAQNNAACHLLRAASFALQADAIPNLTSAVSMANNTLSICLENADKLVPVLTALMQASRGDMNAALGRLLVDVESTAAELACSVAETSLVAGLCQAWADRLISSPSDVEASLSPLFPLGGNDSDLVSPLIATISDLCRRSLRYHESKPSAAAHGETNIGHGLAISRSLRLIGLLQLMAGQFITAEGLLRSAMDRYDGFNCPRSGGSGPDPLYTELEDIQRVQAAQALHIYSLLLFQWEKRGKEAIAFENRSITIREDVVSRYVPSLLQTRGRGHMTARLLFLSSQILSTGFACMYLGSWSFSLPLDLERIWAALNTPQTTANTAPLAT